MSKFFNALNVPVKPVARNGTLSKFLNSFRSRHDLGTEKPPMDVQIALSSLGLIVRCTTRTAQRNFMISPRPQACRAFWIGNAHRTFNNTNDLIFTNSRPSSPIFFFLQLRQYASRRGASVSLKRPSPKAPTKEVHPNAVIGSLIVTNVVVYFYWRYCFFLAQTYGDERRLRWMIDNFMMGMDQIKAGRWWTMLTAAFSHISFLHLAVNMFVFWSFGTPTLITLGLNRFLFVYLASGVSASLGHLFYHMFMKPLISVPTPGSRSIGASGSVMGITTVFGLVYPFSKVLILFVPVPAIGAVLLFVAYDVYNAWRPSGNTDSAGHLGGVAFGAAYYWTKLRPILQKIRIR